MLQQNATKRGGCCSGRSAESVHDHPRRCPYLSLPTHIRCPVFNDSALVIEHPTERPDLRQGIPDFRRAIAILGPADDIRPHWPVLPGTASQLGPSALAPATARLVAVPGWLAGRPPAQGVVLGPARFDASRSARRNKSATAEAPDEWGAAKRPRVTA